MENLFMIQEEKLIQDFLQTNPTKEDYFDIVGENDPEFLRKDYLSLSPENIEIQDYVKSERAKEKRKENRLKERYDIVLPYGCEEIELYDESKTFDENFSIGKSKKYILFEVNKDRREISIGKPEFILPTSLSKCVVDFAKVEEYNSLTFIPVQYETFFGLNIVSFSGYSDFFLVDERIIFEALLIKFKYFDFKPIYWSKEKILEEVGVKKDRSSKILERFVQLGIISKELKKSVIKGRPMQINYYDLNSERIIELIPKIYKERDDLDVEYRIKQYLMPAFKKGSITSLMQ